MGIVAEKVISMESNCSSMKRRKKEWMAIPIWNVKVTKKILVYPYTLAKKDQIFKFTS